MSLHSKDDNKTIITKTSTATSPNFPTTATSIKKLRFRGELNFNNRIDEFCDDERHRSKSTTAIGGANTTTSTATKAKQKQDDKLAAKENATAPSASSSFLDFFKVELTRGYMLEHDEERYTARREKIYSFMRIPRDLERFMVYGIMQCADSFLYIHTFLPVRFALAVWGLFSRPIASCLGFRRRTQRLLTPAEICDILKGVIWITCTMLMLSVDTNRIYHIIKSQSIIKLYIFYNMLEVGDRLLSAFGQDTIDALFWTATEPKNSKREHFGLMSHILFALIYVLLHSFLIMFQATTINVAVNSNNKGLLTIMMSNNFVELKGSVFKKFDKNNLFQLTCSDVRERFHLAVLLFIVIIQTMKEFDWSFSHFCTMLPDCFAVGFTEVLIDWVKHAFITRFNELPESIYREYTTSLAYDMTQTRQKHAFSDHSDLVARRMGFIPFPLGVVLIKAVYTAVIFDNLAAWVLFALAYLFALGLRMCLTICALGKACKLMKEHEDEKSNSTPSSMTNVAPIHSNTNITNIMTGVMKLPSSPSLTRLRQDVATSPISATPQQQQQQQEQQQQDLQQSSTITSQYAYNSYATSTATATSTPINNNNSSISKITKSAQKPSTTHITDIELEAKNSLQLGATALFSNSDVDLDDVCLNEHVLDTNTNSNAFVEEELARSVPDLSQTQQEKLLDDSNNDINENGNCASACNSGIERVRGGTGNTTKRTHKRSESEPSMQSIIGDVETLA